MFHQTSIAIAGDYFMIMMMDYPKYSIPLDLSLPPTSPTLSHFAETFLQFKPIAVTASFGGPCSTTCSCQQPIPEPIVSSDDNDEDNHSIITLENAKVSFLDHNYAQFRQSSVIVYAAPAAATTVLPQFVNPNVSFMSLPPDGGGVRRLSNDAFFDSISSFISHDHDYINYPISTLAPSQFESEKTPIGGGGGGESSIGQDDDDDSSDFFDRQLMIDLQDPSDTNSTNAEHFYFCEEENAKDFSLQPQSQPQTTMAIQPFGLSSVANQFPARQQLSIEDNRTLIGEVSVLVKPNRQRNDTEKENQVVGAQKNKNKKNPKRNKSNNNRIRCFQKFPVKLWDLASDPNFSAINWAPDGKLVCIDRERLMPQLRRHFRTERFPSFLRQLHLYGFRKIRKSHNISNIEIGKFEYYHLKKFNNSTPYGLN